MSEALDRLQAEKEKAERELAQTQHKIQRLENLKGAQPLVGVKRRKTALTPECQGGSASQSARYGVHPV